MEFQVVHKTKHLYTNFFNSTSRDSKWRIGQLYSDVEANLAQPLSIWRGIHTVTTSTIIPNEVYKGLSVNNSIYDSFIYLSDLGGNSKHYFRFGSRVLEITQDFVKWKIDLKSELTPKWIRIAHSQIGISEHKISEYLRTLLWFNANTNQSLHEGDFFTSNNSKSRFSLLKNKKLNLSLNPDTLINNPDILKYSRGLKDEVVQYDKKTKKDVLVSHDLNISDDEVPWCSCFSQWVMKQCGIEGPRKMPALALSWSNWGKVLVNPVFGCLVIFKHKNGTGHVGFVIGKNKNNLVVLGGNQGDRVSISEFTTKEVVSYVYPPDISMNPFDHYLTEIENGGLNQRDR